MVIQTYVFFCDQTHGRANKLPIKTIIFFFKQQKDIIKQIMPGPSGNRLSICHLILDILNKLSQPITPEHQNFPS